MGISFYTHFWSFLVADWNRHLCLFGCFQTGLLSVAMSVLRSCVSWSFGTAREIFLELDSVWVELIDKTELLSRLQFGHIVFTNYQRVYGSWVQTQLGKKTKTWLLLTGLCKFVQLKMIWTTTGIFTQWHKSQTFFLRESLQWIFTILTCFTLT